MNRPTTDLPTNRTKAQDGAVLIEFAVISLVLYLLLAAILSFGTLVQASQIAQDVARLTARELALTPLPPETTFEEALAATTDRIFDPNRLVVDIQHAEATFGSLDAYFATLPLANRALRPVFVFDQLPNNGPEPGEQRRVLRFPGAPLISPEAASHNAGWTVGVPVVEQRTDEGEVVRWLPVVEEVRVDPNDPQTGPFSAASTANDRGLVALRINIPAIAAGFASYDAPTTWPPGPNAGQPHLAIVDAVQSVPGSAPPFGTIPSAWPTEGPQVLRGAAGLGIRGALAQPVRPFRRVFLGQALFRREVYQ